MTVVTVIPWFLLYVCIERKPLIHGQLGHWSQSQRVPFQVTERLRG